MPDPTTQARELLELEVQMRDHLARLAAAGWPGQARPPGRGPGPGDPPAPAHEVAAGQT